MGGMSLYENKENFNTSETEITKLYDAEIKVLTLSIFIFML